jgi:polysaccharide pyruvyl transferase WcaK-like protein
VMNLFCIRPTNLTKGINIGNDIIFIALKKFIYKAFGNDVNFITIPAKGFGAGGKAGLTKSTIYDINSYGDGVIVGGGNLYENGELDVDLDALQALQVPLMLFSLSWGRIYSRKRQLVTRTDSTPASTLLRLHKRANVSLVRDLATGQHLERIGVENHEVGGCPTLFLERKEPAQMPNLPWDVKSTALISIRNPSLMCIPVGYQARVYESVKTIIQLLTQYGYRDVRLLCHDHRDLTFASAFPDTPHIFTEDVSACLALLQSCALNVTYRLHSFLPCLALNTPAIKISYDERALSLIDTIGFGEWNIDMIRENDPMQLVADRLGRLSDLESLRARAHDRWAVLRQRMERACYKFAELVNSDRVEEHGREGNPPCGSKSSAAAPKLMASGM